ncbi:MAG: hypothetical protein E7616_01070 [Ruminococcaceae bacterium]|nr:hypothetical protein [Oscillospiraceae bacterium]
MDRDEYITDAEVVKRAEIAVKLAIEHKKAMNTPIVVYDRETRKVCHLRADGSKTEVENRIKRGRFSEWSKNG